MAVFAAMVASSPLRTPAQQTGTNEMAGQNGTFTLTVNSQLVIETVVGEG
jgi:hypothetical protein